MTCDQCDDLEVARLQAALAVALAELEEARRALGLAWLTGDVSLAEGIRRKTAALEGLQR